ncbi:P-loop containing nucleoside triphosphate hydrolase protein [Rhypophila decipiens]
MLITARPQVKSHIVVDHTSYKTHCGSLVSLKDDKPKYSTDSVQASITENELMMCNKHVMGYYCLKDNKWAVFDIDSISNISFDSETFDAHMFPKEQKRQILSLVRMHEDDRLTFDDFVKGKGRGMVFLLYGDPGTGKTLTAESISDYCKKPLLRLEASTLGTSVNSVEKGLTRAFNLAEKWRQALVLIDEADIYLEQRKSKNLTHNGLVSVFLRILEYYKGILFLTTNRINSFDRAFMSRIHLALHYPPLTHHSRRKLWYLFLKRASPESAEALLQTGAIDKFAEEILNGREIKNVVRTASSLALSSGDSSADSRISPEYIEWALQPMKQFESYIAGVFQREQEAERNHHHREESVAVEDEQHELDDEDNEDEFVGSDEEEDEEEGEDYQEEEPEPIVLGDLTSEESDEDDDDEADDPDAPLIKRRRLEL